MQWFVGIDGGGTKTDFAVCGSDGAIVASVKRTGCSYQAIGVQKAAELLIDGARECLAKACAKLEDCKGCCIGLPCLGENEDTDKQMLKMLQEEFYPIPLHIVNDVEVGWAGSLSCSEGIHIVAGTGSIGFGCGKSDKKVRCGGWNEFFGDEGSCYWLGRKAMSLFSKEADGRAPKGALYDIVRQSLELSNDWQFIEAIVNNWASGREKVASFQIFAEKAALAGDAHAAALYCEAADELTEIVSAIKSQLVFSSPVVPVSYSGGLFKAGKLVLNPLSQRMNAMGCRLQSPQHSAIEGAILLAIKHFK